MQKKMIGALILGMVLVIGACTTFEPLVQKPEIAFNSLAIRNLSLLEGALLFRFTVSNPNPVGISVDDILYDLDINGENFTGGRLAKGLNLAASGTSPMEIPLTINYLKFFNSFSRLIQSDALDYRLTGSVGVGRLRIPYQTSGKIDVPKMPEITVDSIKVDSFSLTGAALKLAVGMRNPNAFAIKMVGLEYTVRLEDVELAKGVTRKVIPLAGKGYSMMDIDLILNFIELSSSAQTLLSGSPARCHFTGNMRVNTLAGMQKIPFQFDGKVPFIK